MFLQKFFNRPTNNRSPVCLHMKNVGADIQKNDDNVIIIDDETAGNDPQNERPITDKLNTKSKEKKNTNLEPVRSEMNDTMNARITARKKDPRLVEAVALEKHLHNNNLHLTEQGHSDGIVGYADEPLLPLMDACTPLANIIPNLSRYVRAALNETPPQPADGLTFDESASIRLYTIEWDEPNASLYSMLNATLKNLDRRALRPYFKYLKLFLTALVKLPCAPLQTVWRGVNKDLSKKFPLGTAVTWWGLSSCTISLTVLENSIYLANSGERTLFSVEAINGRIIQAHSHFNFEDEILLLPGTYMEVQSQASPADDLHIIHLRQFKPADTLLELPFKGAHLYPPEVKRIPWYKKKRTIIELTLLLALCLAGVIVALVLGTRGPRPPKVCYTRRTGIKTDLLWSFDCEDAREDLRGVTKGSEQNAASYSSPDFSGQGYALSLNRKLRQYVHLPYSLNLSMNTSFTVSAWIFSTGSNPAMILSDCNALNSVCIELYVYGAFIDAETFTWNNKSSLDYVYFNGTTVSYQSSWQHMAFVFDNQTSNLVIYYNGYLVAQNDFLPSYFAVNQTNGDKTTSIGLGSMPIDRNAFDGLIDQLSISYYAKNDSDILEEATLLCYYTFENNNVSTDSGPNNIPGQSQNVYQLLSSGQGTLLFNSTDSFFQSSGFTLSKFVNYEFSITFWIRPIQLKSAEINSATAVLQLASRVQGSSSESYVCFLTISIVNSTTDRAYFRIDYGQLYLYWAFEGSIVMNNTWTHFGLSYSNGIYINFYVNGLFIGTSQYDQFSSLLYNPRLTVTVGGSYFDDLATTEPTDFEARKCFAQNSGLNFTQFYGEIDDLKVFSRALTDDELLDLANSTNKTSVS